MLEIIAEAGVNHNGKLDLALRLVDAAAAAGADYVKFQTFCAEKLVTGAAAKAGYQLKTAGPEESQLGMLKRLELDRDAHQQIINRCGQKGIHFLSTAFDFASIDLLRDLGVRIWKVPSGEITNVPFLRRIGSFGERVILSTGMAWLGEVDFALRTLVEAGTPRARITVLHCTTEYPAPIDQVNLRAMAGMGAALGVEVGYSDHTEGIEVAVAAAALGARVIEKHFTLDRSLPGPDHRASLEPAELAAMVAAVRRVERALGGREKAPSAAERSNLAAARKSIVAARPIRRGEVFTAENLTAKRPGTGLSPVLWDALMGMASPRDFRQDEPICLT
jgi:N,N'-diacetyllegionaminate synthase